MASGRWPSSSLLLLITLLIVSFRASAAQREHTAMRARTEIASHNAFYTVRDTLSYANEAERYLLGGSTRRAVQVTRALLGQRLQVVGTDGVTAGDAATPAYRSALARWTTRFARFRPASCRPTSVRAGRDVVLPKANALTRGHPRVELQRTGRSIPTATTPPKMTSCGTG